VHIAAERERLRAIQIRSRSNFPSKWLPHVRNFKEASCQVQKIASREASAAVSAGGSGHKKHAEQGYFKYQLGQLKLGLEVNYIYL
jgi:hypothetical protein